MTDAATTQPPERGPGSNPWRALLPLGLFIALAGFLAFGLTRDPSALPTQLLDQPLPEFSAQTLDGETVTRAALVGEPALVNVFGSWCTACLVEHPLLMQLPSGTRLIGLNWRDQNDKARAWLARHGDPYDLIVTDPRSDLAVRLGVTGAPETFVIDAQGRIRYKHTGPILPTDWSDTVKPLLQALRDPPSSTGEGREKG